MRCGRITVTRRGPPEVLQVVENDLRPPSSREAQVNVLTTPVCSPDVTSRYGRKPFAPSVPSGPGYAIIGVVDGIGSDVTKVAVGDTVGAIMVYGGLC